MNIFLTDFAYDRHFNRDFAGTKVLGITRKLFVWEVNEEFTLTPRLIAQGYAGFCIHFFLRNRWGSKSGVHPITDENRHLLQVGYEARREGELPVLTSWFNQEDVEPQVAPWLDLVLYSADQLREEGVKVPKGMEWGIVAILSSDAARETPMKPITMMRNALGKDQGGSGVPLDTEAYQEAVAYWSDHATIR